MNKNGATSAMALYNRIGEASCGAMRAATACCLAILELRVRAAGPVDRSIFDVFRQNTRVANTTEVRLLDGLTHWSDLHELLKNAQPSSTRPSLRRGSATTHRFAAVRSERNRSSI